MDVGIVGYGAYIPKFRISVEEIAKVWARCQGHQGRPCCGGEERARA